jgi:hypothetical protein
VLIKGKRGNRYVTNEFVRWPAIRLMRTEKHLVQLLARSESRVHDVRLDPGLLGEAQRNLPDLHRFPMSSTSTSPPSPMAAAGSSKPPPPLDELR